MEEVSPQPSHINGSSELIMKKSKISKGHKSFLRKLKREALQLHDELVYHEKTSKFLLKQIEDVELFESLSEREQRALYNRLELENNYQNMIKQKLVELGDTVNRLHDYLS